MRKKHVILVLVVIILSVSLSGCITQKTPKQLIKAQPPIPTDESGFGEYLHYRGGEETKVFLINSYARYGAYYRDIDLPSSSAKKGDPCVVINGTIRNDYDRDYYISLSADIFNPRGEEVGTVISYNAPLPGFTVVHAKSGYTAPFEIYVKYDGEEDIIRYDIFVEYQPTESAPA